MDGRDATYRGRSKFASLFLTQETKLRTNLGNGRIVGWAGFGTRICRKYILGLRSFVSPSEQFYSREVPTTCPWSAQYVAGSVIQPFLINIACQHSYRPLTHLLRTSRRHRLSIVTIYIEIEINIAIKSLPLKWCWHRYLKDRQKWKLLKIQWQRQWHCHCDFVTMIETNLLETLFERLYVPRACTKQYSGSGWQGYYHLHSAHTPGL